MSELDKWEKDSQKATGLLGLVATAGIAMAAKALIGGVTKSTGDDLQRRQSESALEREKSRTGLDKILHARDLEEAQREYDKWH